MQSLFRAPRATAAYADGVKQRRLNDARALQWRLLGAFLLSVTACATLAKDYSSGSKSLRFTCVDDNRWVNGTRLELRGNLDKGEGWLRVQGGPKQATQFEQQALKYVWLAKDSEDFMIVVEPDLSARYYDNTGLSPTFASVRWYCKPS